jgi:hypothetical protein
MCWWVLCFVVGLAIIWFKAGLDTPEAVGMTLFAVTGYTLAIFIPMYIAKP